MSRGALEIRSAEGLIVNGSARISGVLNGDGTITWTGPAQFIGQLTVDGPTTVNGNSDFNGVVNIDGPLGVNGLAYLRGDTEVTGDLSLLAGGRLKAGVLEIGPGLGGGGGGVFSSGDLFLTASGANAVRLSNTRIGGDLVVTGTIDLGTLPSSTAGANVVADGGVLKKVSSASRFKLDAQPMELSESLLLDIPIKDWIDKGQHDRGEDTVRIPGVIAEEVEAAGGESFVTYDQAGVIESVAYDRLALARTQILAEKLATATGILARVVGVLEQYRAAFIDAGIPIPTSPLVDDQV